VHRYPSEQVQTFVVGSEAEENKNPQNEHTILWSVAHAKEDNLIVASREPVAPDRGEEKKAPPVNLISAGVPVQYQITNLADWAYINEEPQELIHQLASREVVRYLASADVDEVMARGRTAAGQALRERIQAQVSEHRLGAKILFVGIEDIHPPVKVAEDFEKVIGAVQKKEAKILEAKAYAFKTNALARGEAFKRERDAEASRARRIAEASARAALFTNQVAAYSAAPAVYAQRAYLRTFASGAVNSRKYVIGVTNTAGVFQLNLEDKIDPNMIDRMIDKMTKK
jgi:regulator of protease activity HflC (stomatin/prohibitin superfamily)